MENKLERTPDGYFLIWDGRKDGHDRANQNAALVLNCNRDNGVIPSDYELRQYDSRLEIRTQSEATMAAIIRLLLKKPRDRGVASATGQEPQQTA